MPHVLLVGQLHRLTAIVVSDLLIQPGDIVHCLRRQRAQLHFLPIQKPAIIASPITSGVYFLFIIRQSHPDGGACDPVV